MEIRGFPCILDNRGDLRHNSTLLVFEEAQARHQNDQGFGVWQASRTGQVQGVRVCRLSLTRFGPCKSGSEGIRVFGASIGAKTGRFGTASCRWFCLPKRVCVGVDDCETICEMIVRFWSLFADITDCQWTLIRLSIYRQTQHTQTR